MDEAIRNLFPVTKQKIYMDNAYISPTPITVLQAAADYEKKRSLGCAGRTDDWAILMDQCKNKFASLVNTSASQIAITGNTSEGTNIVANMLNLQTGDNVLWDDMDHISNKLIWLKMGKRKGFENRIISPQNGQVSVDAYAKRMDDSTKVISISLVAHNNGFLYEVEKLAELAHSRNAFLHVDAIQAVGSIQVDLSSSGIDFLTCGTYKWLCGPQGLGFFYIREKLLSQFDPVYGGWMQLQNWLQDARSPQIQLFEDARKFQTATLDPRGLVELNTSLDLILEVGIEAIEKHNLSLASKLWEGLKNLDFDLFTPAGIQSSIVALHSKESGRLGKYLEEQGCVVTAREDIIRISPHFFNNMDEIEKFLSFVKAFN